jgi:radical SAM-linked protein
MGRCEPEKIAVSLPSLRVGSLSAAMMEQIKRVRKTGFTLAPEAGSARLRDVINKNVTESDLLENVEQAFRSGWRLIKLYFMVGLPTEMDEDVDAIIDLVGRLRKPSRPGARRRDIHVSVSTFVPKSHTPFQWARQITLEESREKIQYLRRRLTGKGIRFKWQNPEMSVLEGLWARGDRRLSKLLEEAFEMGCRFDGWSDQFRFSVWQEAMAATGIDIATYLRSRNQDTPLPWDHIKTGVQKAFLSREWKRAMAGETLGDCRQGDCHHCGVCDFETLQPITFDDDALTTVSINKLAGTSKTTVFRKCQVFYQKTGSGRFFGHLEMVKVITRALRRANIPMRFTQGFHPSPKMSFSSPLPVGVESTEEYFIVEVSGRVKANELIEKVNAQLPEGLQLTKGVFVGASKTKEATVLHYTIRLHEGEFLKERLDAYQTRRSWPIERKNKKGRTRTIDLKKIIVGLRLVSSQVLRMRMDISEGKHARPSEVLESVFALPARTIQRASIVKTPAGRDRNEIGRRSR